MWWIQSLTGGILLAWNISETIETEWLKRDKTMWEDYRGTDCMWQKHSLTQELLMHFFFVVYHHHHYPHITMSKVHQKLLSRQQCYWRWLHTHACHASWTIASRFSNGISFLKTWLLANLIVRVLRSILFFVHSYLHKKIFSKIRRWIQLSSEVHYHNYKRVFFSFSLSPSNKWQSCSIKSIWLSGFFLYLLIIFSIHQ